MHHFDLKILACDKVFFEGECESIIFPTYDGDMAVMANHEQMSASVEIGEIRFKTPDGEWHNAVVSDGLLKVENNKVIMLVYSAERPEDIDKYRAEAAKERAGRKLQEKQSLIEYNISTANLARAMARLHGYNKHVDRFSM